MTRQFWQFVENLPFKYAQTEPGECPAGESAAARQGFTNYLSVSVPPVVTNAVCETSFLIAQCQLMPLSQPHTTEGSSQICWHYSRRLRVVKTGKEIIEHQLLCSLRRA